MLNLQKQELQSGQEGPVLQRVRLCCDNPDMAVDFYSKILNPCPDCRMGADALLHPYLKSHTYQMLHDLDRGSKLYTCLIHQLHNVLCDMHLQC